MHGERYQVPCPWPAFDAYLLILSARLMRGALLSYSFDEPYLGLHSESFSFWIRIYTTLK